jgi:hypothetical protein
MIMPKLILASLVVLVGVATAGVVLAHDDKSEDAMEKAALGEAKFTLAEAIAAAQALVPGGLVLKAAVDTENGVPTYVVDLDKNGMQRVLIDIRSGQAKTLASEAGKSENGDDQDEDEDDDDDDEEEDGD